jgi:hypothetical protein
MPASQAEKVERFRELHRRAGAFVMPNPWCQSPSMRRMERLMNQRLGSGFAP